MILIDTNVGVWSVYQPDRLGAAARDLLRTDGSPFFSAVLAIETTIKRMNGRLPDEVVDLPAILTTNGLRELAVTAAHALGMSEFSQLARHDPFDRLLVAQAHVEGARLLTADRRLLGLGLSWIIDAKS